MVRCFARNCSTPRIEAEVPLFGVKEAWLIVFVERDDVLWCEANGHEILPTKKLMLQVFDRDGLETV